MSQSCVFCGVTPQTPEFIAGYEHTSVILSNPRLVLGHILIIPNRHMETPGELTSEEQEEIFRLAIEYGRKIIISRHAKGFDLRMNYRPFILPGRLKVNHVHMHVLPRWPYSEDRLYQKSMHSEAALFENVAEQELIKYIQLYRQ